MPSVKDLVLVENQYGSEIYTFWTNLAHHIFSQLYSYVIFALDTTYDPCRSCLDLYCGKIGGAEMIELKILGSQKTLPVNASAPDVDFWLPLSHKEILARVGPQID